MNSNVALEVTNYFNFVNVAIDDIIVTLPSAIDNLGREINIKHNTNSDKKVIIQTVLSQDIDGDSEVVLNSYENLTLISNNSNAK